MRLSLSPRLRSFLLPKFTRRYLLRLVSLAVFCWFFFGWICRPCFLNGESMVPTFPARGLVFCWRPAVWFTSPVRGKVVVLRFVGQKVYLLKRIVALEGDTLEFQDGTLFVNGQPEEVTWKTKGECHWNLPPRTVEEGCVYVIGDNRTMRMDEHLFGQVSVSRLEGVPVQLKEVFAMRNLVIGLVVFLLGVGVVYFWMHSSPERKIRRRFVKLLEAVSKEEKETNSTKAVKLFALQSLFGNTIELQIADLPMNGSYTCEELSAEVMRGRLFCNTIHLSLNGIEISLEGKEKAVARVSATAEITTQGNGTWKERREIQVRAELQDKNWRFTAFQEDPLLKK